MWFIWLMGGMFVGGVIGFFICAILAGNQYEKGYVDGFKNEKKLGRWLD